jgi:hypothetical protein
MRLFLNSIIIGMILFSCKAQQKAQFEELDINKIFPTDGVTFWFDMKDPISYGVNYDGINTTVIIFTHSLKDGKIVFKKYSSTSEISEAFFENLNTKFLKVVRAFKTTFA